LIYESGLALAFLFSVNSNPFLARSSNFSRNLVFWGNFGKFMKLAISRFLWLWLRDKLQSGKRLWSITLAGRQVTQIVLMQSPPYSPELQMLKEDNKTFTGLYWWYVKDCGGFHGK